MQTVAVVWRRCGMPRNCGKKWTVDIGRVDRRLAPRHPFRENGILCAWNWAHEGWCLHAVQYSLVQWTRMFNLPRMPHVWNMNSNYSTYFYVDKEPHSSFVTPLRTLFRVGHVNLYFSYMFEPVSSNSSAPDKNSLTITEKPNVKQFGGRRRWSKTLERIEIHYTQIFNDLKYFIEHKICALFYAVAVVPFAVAHYYYYCCYVPWASFISRHFSMS